MPFSFDILPQDAPNQACSHLLPSQRVALVRELQTVAPWLSEREALALLASDPNVLSLEGKAKLKAAGQSILPLERAGMSVGAAGLGQEAEGVAAVAIGCSQVKALPKQLLNNSGAAGVDAGAFNAGADVVPVSAPISTLDACSDGLAAVHWPGLAVQPVRDLAEAARLLSGAVASADPPFCITGGQSANPKNPNPKTQTQNNQNSVDIPCAGRGVTLKPDWLQFTMPVPAVSEVAEVERLKVLLGGDWQELEGGMYRYQKRLRCGSLWILWQGVSEGMGVHVQASGQGVSELEARGVTDWRGWLAARLSEGAKFRRTDFAFDVKDGSLSVDMVEEAARAGLVSSHFDTLEPVIKFDGQGNVTDRGFNFGNRAADTSVCFYDKALEQKKKRLAEGKKEPDMQAALDKQKELEASWASEPTAPGCDTSAAICSTEQTEAGEQWTRCELRNRNDRAQKLVQQIVEVGWSVVAGVLSAALDMKERGEGKQRCRWNTVKWWSDFLGDAEKARLVLDPVIRTLQAGMVALERQYGPLLAACGLVVPNFWDWAQGVALRRLETLSRRHWGMVGAYVEQRDAAPPNGGTRRVAPLGAGKVVAI